MGVILVDQQIGLALHVPLKLILNQQMIYIVITDIYKMAYNILSRVGVGGWVGGCRHFFFSFRTALGGQGIYFIINQSNSDRIPASGAMWPGKLSPFKQNSIRSKTRNRSRVSCLRVQEPLDQKSDLQKISHRHNQQHGAGAKTQHYKNCWCGFQANQIS